MHSIMELLKVYVVLFSLFATALTCDLTETDAEKTAKAELETYITTAKASVKSTYRLHYHIAPPCGWMNDPNGFSYFKDNYHLFYQYNPKGTQPNNNIHWGHVTSTDLVSWTQQVTALLPGDEQCFSGSAIVKDGTMILMYTAHKTLSGQTPDHNETQYLAFSNDGVVFNKYKNNPVISFTPDNSPEFRDPKVWKYGDDWYVILGSQIVATTTAAAKGKVLLYKSSDLGTWKFVSVLAQSTGSDNMGTMWECPDFFELENRYVLLMSPQGIEATDDRFKNLYQTGYIIGTFDYDTGTFTPSVAFQEIDYGHDFYATQTLEKDGKRYLIAWMGMWPSTSPETADDGWAGAMTITRELSFSGDRILMKPLAAMDDLRVTPAVSTGELAQNTPITLTETGDLVVTLDLTKEAYLSFQGASDTEAVITLKYDLTTQKVVLDRKGDVRQALWTPVSSSTWRIFLDASSIEVFCGEGEMVFSSRVYPSGVWTVTNLASDAVTVEAYTLNKSVA